MRLLSLSGLIPEQICDTVRFTGYPGEPMASQYCGYASDFISQVMHDISIDGAVFPRTCDSSRAMTSLLAGTDKFFYQLNVPARQDESAINYFANEIKRYQVAVENAFSIKINDIDQRISLINRRNLEISKIYEHLDELSFLDYIRAIHTMLKLPLQDQNFNPHMSHCTGSKKVYLVGSFLTSISFIDAIEKAGMKIAGDNLPESKRLFSAPPVSGEGDIYKNIAKSILQNRTSPSQNNFEEIIKNDLEEILEKHIHGVIFATQKYCEPYDYLFSVYKKRLEAYSIPIIQLKSTDSGNSQKMDSFIEAFADMI